MRYWSKNPDRPDNGAPEIPQASVPNTELPTIAVLSVDETTTESRKAATVRSTAGPSTSGGTTASKLSFSTVARTTFDDAESQNFRVKTNYAQSDADSKQRNRVPDFPKFDPSASPCDLCHNNNMVDGQCSHGQTCPYCQLDLDKKTIEDRQNWK